MKTKICTDVEQSKKLLELGIDVKSADMFWLVTDKPRLHVLTEDLSKYANWENYPAWSLSALLNLMPAEIQTKESIEPYTLMLFKTQETSYQVEYGYRAPMTVGWLNAWYEVKCGTDLVDATFEMVCWLKENEKI